MVEVEDCYNAIKKLQRNFHSTVIEKMDQTELFKLAKDWQEQFKYWALLDFKKVINHIIRNNKCFPKSSTIWAIKKEIIKESRGLTKIAFTCGYCKDTGIRGYKDKENIIHVCRCDCKTGLKHYTHLPIINEIKKEGLSEYKIHVQEEGFGGIPREEQFRICREIAGNDQFICMLINNVENKMTKNLNGLVKPLFQDKVQDDEELPF